MKMRIKKLVFVGLIALGLASCSNDDNLPGDGGNGAAVKGYITLNITNPKGQPSLDAGTSRTVGDNTQVGEGVENTIKNVKVVLADAEGKIKTSFESEQFVDEEKQRITAPQEVELGTYFVYAIVNPADNVVANEGESIQQVIKEVTENAAKAGFSGGNFMMINANEGVDELGGVEVEVKATNTKANPAKAVVPVDRVAVKVVNNTSGVIFEKIEEGSDAANLLTDLKVEGFVLINGNTQFNLIQSWEKLGNESVVLATPSEKGNYYNPITEYGLVEVKDGKTTLTDLTLDKEVFGSDAVYTIENRPEFLYTQNLEELTSGMGVTTGVIYHMVANKGETFFVYKGKAYKEVDVLAKHPDFAVYNAVTGKVEEGKSTIDGVKDNFPALRGYGVQVYEKGNMYYTYFIEDQNYTVLNKQSKPTKYNAVMRNSVYNLSIQKITELGDDIPGGGVIDPENPNPPIKTDKAYIQVEVTVRPWVLNDIKIDF